MSKISFISISFLFYFTLFKGMQGDETLKSVQVLFRHGDRTPDIGDQIGLGRLTENGKKEAYDLGLFLRERYKNFLPVDYDPDDVSLLSSDTDRTIQSSLLLAYGLYKDFNSEAEWGSPSVAVPYEPIPVRHVPQKHDKYFQMSKSCKRREQLYEESVGRFTYNYIVENPDVINLYTSRKENVSLFDPNRSIISRIDPLIAFNDEIMYNISHNLAVEPWCMDLINNRNYFGVKTSYYRAVVDSREKQRFYNGPLVSLLFQNFEENNKQQSMKKMQLYCLHDKTLFTFMVTLGIDDKEVLLLPPTSSALMVELHDNNTMAGPYLKIWYRNLTDSEPHYLDIPGCGSPCYLSKAKELKEYVIPANYEAECQYEAPEFDGQSANTTIYLWAGAVAMLLIFGLAVYTGTRSKRNYEKV